MREVKQRPLKVLLVEEDSSQRDTVENLLSSAEGPRMEMVWSGYLSDALKKLSEGGIDVVLLDLSLPDSEGIVSFERAYAFAPDVPIIVLTDLDDESLAMATVQGGAQDYLLKDEIESNLLLRSIRYAVERHRLISALRSLSLMDDLTGLYNRRGFSELGAQQLKLARRMSRGVLLVYADLDRFKTINDTLGHHVGDRALMKMSELFKATFRRSDLIARLEGDEFAVLALEASKDDASLMTSRLRERFRSFNEKSREPYKLSASLGVARFDSDDPSSLDELLARADRRMREEKRAKRPTVTPGRGQAQ